MKKGTNQKKRQRTSKPSHIERATEEEHSEQSRSAEGGQQKEFHGYLNKKRQKVD